MRWVLANQKHTNLLQLNYSTTYQKVANFHLLQKTIWRYTCYVRHKRCPQGLDFQGALATWNSSIEKEVFFFQKLYLYYQKFKQSGLCPVSSSNSVGGKCLRTPQPMWFPSMLLGLIQTWGFIMLPEYGKIIFGINSCSVSYHGLKQILLDKKEKCKNTSSQIHLLTGICLQNTKCIVY